MLPNCLFIERNPNRKDVVELHCSCPEKQLYFVVGGRTYDEAFFLAEEKICKSCKTA